jgi:membrane-associated phospholipid phosphatase
LSTIENTRSRFMLFTTEFMVVIFLAVALLILAYSVHIAFFEAEQALDKKAFDFIAPFQSGWYTGFFRFITFFGGYEFLIPANLLLVSLYFFRKNKPWALRISVIALSSLGLKILLKVSIQRIRPPESLLENVRGFSFPSGHAMMSVVFYGLVIYFIHHSVKNRLLRISFTCALVLFILLIGFSRIYLRVHYASDVLAGLSIGFIWLVLSLWTTRKIESAWPGKNRADSDSLKMK